MKCNLINKVAVFPEIAFFVMTHSLVKMEAPQTTPTHARLKDQKERKTIYLTEKGELVVW